MVEFIGLHHKIRLEPSPHDDGRVMVTMFTEDDMNWIEKDSFSSFWVDDLLEQLNRAKEYLDTRCDKVEWGYKFKSKGESKNV